LNYHAEPSILKDKRRKTILKFDRWRMISMNKARPVSIYHKLPTLKTIGALLLLNSSVGAAFDVFSTDTTINGTTGYSANSGIIIRPGITVTVADLVTITFDPASSLIFEVDGDRVGRIDGTGNPNGSILLIPGSSVIMRVVGAQPSNRTYELIRGAIDTQDPTAPINVILQNGEGASITTDFHRGDALTGYLWATIAGGNKNPTSTSQTVIDQTITTSDDTFNGNITDNIPQDSCSSISSSNNFNYSTPTNIAMTLHRFVGASRNIKTSKYTPLLALPGVKARQTDMLKVLNEGQMPTSQFNLLNKGVRVWITSVYNYFKNKLSKLDYKAQSKGFQIGIDSTAKRLPIGLSFAYMATRPEVASSSIGRNRTAQVGLYGGYGFNNFMVFGTTSYIHGHNKLGNLTRKHFTTNSFSAHVMGSYSHHLSGKNILEPLVALSYGHTWVPTIHEYLGSVITSTSKAKESNSVRSELGLKWSHFIGLDNKEQTPLKFYIQALWKHNYRNQQKTGNTQFIGSTVVTNLVGQRQPKNTADLGAGLIIRKDDIDVTLSYGGSFAKKVQSHSGMAGIRIKI